MAEEREGVLVAGTITRDYVDSPTVHLEGELGGSATYFALGARHFCPVSIVAAVGDDRADDVREVLSFADLSRLTISTKPTYAWHARRDSVEMDAVTVRGFGAAYEGFQPQVSATEDWHDAVFLASLDPAVQLDVVRNARAGVLLGADTMDTFIRDRRRNFEEVVNLVRLLIINTTELEMLTQTRGIAAAAEHILLRFRGVSAVMVKRGADGAVLVTRGGSRRLPAYKAIVVDPTGAGDVLAGAVMGRLVRGGRRLDQESLVDALQWGIVAASFAVERPGIAGIRNCTAEELQARFEAYRLQMHPREAGKG